MLISVGEFDIDGGGPGSSALARPKSSTLTVPSGVTLMFAGLRSRWTMPLLVRGFERVGDLPRDPQRLVQREGGPGQAVGERRRPRPAPGPGTRAAGLFEAVDAGDVRMVERGEDLRLALEAVPAARDPPRTRPAGS